jgi:hypothetical protein
MQIVQGDEIPIDVMTSNVRAGELKKRHMLTGDEGSPGNFKFGLFYQTGDFYSPRHRHNFDQFRFQLEGECDFDRNGTMTPNVLGYFPEGAFYGPQTSDQPNVVAVVQFGGPSGSGYLSPEQVTKAAEAMKKIGVFDKGVFRRNDGVEGKKNMDSFQATWEFANQRPMVYPTPQYADPILMQADNYRWVPIESEEGVEEKAFGTFSNCKICCAQYRISSGAKFRGVGRGIYLVLEGRGSVEGKAMRKLTSVYLETGEKATFQADETATILFLGLPDVALMKTQPVVKTKMVAA